MTPTLENVPRLNALPPDFCGPLRDPSLAEDWWHTLLHLSERFPVRMNAAHHKPFPLVTDHQGQLLIAEYEMRSPTLPLFVSESRVLMTRERNAYRGRKIAIEVALKLLAASYGLPLREEVNRGNVYWTSGPFNSGMPDSLLSLAFTLNQARDWQVKSGHHATPPLLKRGGLPSPQVLLDTLLLLTKEHPQAFRVRCSSPHDTRLYFAQKGSLEPLVRWVEGKQVRFNSLAGEVAVRTLLQRPYNLTYHGQGTGRITCRLKHRGQPPILGQGRTSLLALCDAARQATQIRHHP